MIQMLQKVGWKKSMVETEVPFVPISGWVGDNLIKKSENMKWWKGMEVAILGDAKNKITVETLYDVLDKMVKTPERKLDAPMRTPLSGVYKIKGVGDVLTGRVEQGSVKPNDEVVFLPTHTSSTPCTGKVFTVEMHHKQVPVAGPGDNVGMNVKGLNKSNMPRVGDVMVLKTDESIGRAKSFVVQVQVLHHPGELKVGYTPIGFVRTGRSAVKMSKIDWKIGKETGGAKQENPPMLKANEVAQCVFEPQQPFVVDTFKNCEGLGRIAIMEGNTVVMLGKITSVEKDTK
jgi:elongation factor 1-alpha